MTSRDAVTIGAERDLAVLREYAEGRSVDLLGCVSAVRRAHQYEETAALRLVDADRLFRGVAPYREAREAAMAEAHVASAFAFYARQQWANAVEDLLRLLSTERAHVA